MAKTIKEMTEELHDFLAKTQYCDCLHEYKECQIYDRILKIQDKHEDELAKKDKLASEEAMLRINEYQKLKKEIDAKDKEYGILLADRDKLEMYRHNRLKKSDVEVKIWCSHCEYWVTDDIQDCYCQCTCKETEDYSCIYEEDINAENDCPRNKEWIWQYEISNKKYESLEE